MCVVEQQRVQTFSYHISLIVSVLEMVGRKSNHAVTAKEPNDFMVSFRKDQMIAVNIPMWLVRWESELRCQTWLKDGDLISVKIELGIEEAGSDTETPDRGIQLMSDGPEKKARQTTLIEYCVKTCVATDKDRATLSSEIDDSMLVTLGQALMEDALDAASMHYAALVDIRLGAALVNCWLSLATLDGKSSETLIACLGNSSVGNTEGFKKVMKEAQFALKLPGSKSMLRFLSQKTCGHQRGTQLMNRGRQCLLVAYSSASKRRSFSKRS